MNSYKSKGKAPQNREAPTDKCSRREAIGRIGGLALYPLINGLLPKISGSKKFKKEVKSFKIGDTKIKLLIFSKGNSKVTYFAPHANELDSFKAAKKMINKHGGRLIAFSNKYRQISFSLGDKKYAFNANRCFSDEGIKTTLEKWGQNEKYVGYSEEAHEAVRQFAKSLIKELLANQPGTIVGVHNNLNGEKLAEKEMDIGDIHSNPEHDSDDFFLVIDKKHFDYLKNKNYNVILESEDADDDGSFSVYCRENCIPYVNVEAEYGHLKEQMVMLKELREMIKQLHDI